MSDDVLPEMKSNLTEHCKHYGHIEIIGSGGNINKLCKLYPDEPEREKIRITQEEAFVFHYGKDNI